MTLSVNDFTAGDVITASAMNTNFATIEGYVNSSPGLAQLTGATFSGAVTFSAGITSTGGTTALGTTNITGEVNVGTSGSGHDVYFHSATASDNLHWDASDEKLVITGTAGQDALHVAAGNATFAGLLTANGGLTLQDGDTFTFDGESLTDCIDTGETWTRTNSAIATVGAIIDQFLQYDVDGGTAQGATLYIQASEPYPNGDGAGVKGDIWIDT